MNTSNKPLRILLTPGEPAGVGPELAIMAAQRTYDFELIAIADPTLLKERAKQVRLELNIVLINDDDFKSHSSIQTTIASSNFPAKTLRVLPISLSKKSQAGLLDQVNAPYVLECLQKANDILLGGYAHAVVTGPVQKSIINKAGITFSGHTEFFAEKSNTNKVVMMLATKDLRVALATTHLPLKDVSASITKASLKEVITILHHDLHKKFGISHPRILVCGLNPHAGEEGHLGQEEIITIKPVLETLRKQGMNLIGPLPADTLFTPKYLRNADAVLAMYHDQGLPVLKYQGFGEAVNITLGLPYIRTSVDHGTALDIAGLGTCDNGSLTVALDYAAHLAKASQSI